LKYKNIINTIFIVSIKKSETDNEKKYVFGVWQFNGYKTEIKYYY
jgi:hypothetical protein